MKRIVLVLVPMLFAYILPATNMRSSRYYYYRKSSEKYMHDVNHQDIFCHTLANSCTIGSNSQRRHIYLHV